MSKSLKATYTFSHKIKLTYLTANKPEKQTNIHGRSSHEKNMFVNTEVQSGSCVKYNV